MKQKINNYAFIDAQNLNLSIQSLGWKVDFHKFRIYLKDKYKIEKAFFFLGYVKENENLYKKLRKVGFEIIFKPILKYKNGKIKGNVDAELVLQTMIEYSNFDQAVIVTGDGDFFCLVKYLIKQHKLKKLLVPNEFKYSALLKRFPSEYLAFVNQMKEKIAINEKNPVRTNP